MAQRFLEHVAGSSEANSSSWKALMYTAIWLKKVHSISWYCLWKPTTPHVL